ncbi:MAG: hypothetical protein KJ970_19355 [Candidatus Eisenbacteria bacterium]|uniref:Uncharacterized protein n=1 Tax=Eiseniibacteriota bacterium TaxID=2212470 RepID=A0A948S3E7_UNCEI|nr:hypothetical protein [Candidatus Eisenbacteria bacterium]MBU1947483.1 hypothetical protein [Candidatus Eisenbacteria bacterium]MBU2693079.1 hypothetical protein [Candidatus Eisenbacteria bacterium]
MARRPKTKQMLDYALKVLKDEHPMTVRQVFYQLVSRQVIENKKSAYNAVSKLLVEARRSGEVEWDWIVDRLRVPLCVEQWTDIPDYMESVRQAYRRHVWQDQPGYLEVWLEKDALSGIFNGVLSKYGVILNIGRGYDGWTSLRNASQRFQRVRRNDKTILYFGDFDPSGEDMFYSLQKRLDWFGGHTELIKVAITPDDIARYNIPTAKTKKSDSRQKAFVAKHGDRTAELDALPPSVLRERITTEVCKRMDMDAFAETQDQEDEDVRKLERIVENCV